MAAYNPAESTTAALNGARRTPGRSRTDDVFRALRLAIVQGEIRSVERLTEEGIAARFEVSRTPVRESLRRLEQEGLVEHLSYGGYSVRRTDFRATTELYEIRVALEEVSVERACGASERSLLDKLAQCWEKPETNVLQDLDVVYADEEFHETLAVIAGNETLHAMLRGINARLHALRVRDFTARPRIEATFRQHAAILGAIRAQDRRLASALIRAHIIESQAYVEQAARELEAYGA